MRRMLTLTTFVLAVAFSWLLPIRADTGPTLAMVGDHFTVGGTPKFLIFISYFDALHTSVLRASSPPIRFVSAATGPAPQ